MLRIIIPETKCFDEKTNSILFIPKTELQLEHSLLSISKWESKWLVPFLSKENKTTQQILDYIKCMTITQNVDDYVYNAIPQSEISKITEYINAPMTATTFSNNSNKKNTEIITSEIIYYWMIASNIPMECQKWHLNRLLSLIKVCSIKNNPDKKKLSTSEIMANNKALNEARKAKLHTRG